MAKYITCPVRSEFVYNGNTTENVLVSMASLQAVISYRWWKGCLHTLASVLTG